MKLNKGEQILQIKTGDRQQSEIDLFSKLQCGFLQKYFKYNLIDYFPQYFTNLYQDYFDRKIYIKQQKNLISSIFIANSQFTIQQFSKSIEEFYITKSKSVTQQLLPIAFQKVYPKVEKNQDIIDEGQLIFVDVKIKAQIQKIQEAPQKLIYALQNYRHQQTHQNQSQLQSIFKHYNKESISMFFVYFGDINFQIFNKYNYQKKNLKIFGKYYKLKMFVFFVSKQTLIQSFKLLNKIDHLVHINDLIIQFYQLKRQKHRRKRVKENQSAALHNLHNNLLKNKFDPTIIAFGVFGVIGIVTFCVAIKKMFF